MNPEEKREKEVLKECSLEHRFIIADRPISTLSQLHDIVKELPDQIFYSHVTPEKNDFANWVEHCLNNDIVATRLRNISNKEEFLNFISQELVKSEASELVSNAVEDTAIKDQKREEVMKSEQTSGSSNEEKLDEKVEISDEANHDTSNDNASNEETSDTNSESVSEPNEQETETSSEKSQEINTPSDVPMDHLSSDNVSEEVSDDIPSDEVSDNSDTDLVDEPSDDLNDLPSDDLSDEPADDLSSDKVSGEVIDEPSDDLNDEPTDDLPEENTVSEIGSEKPVSNSEDTSEDTSDDELSDDLPDDDLPSDEISESPNNDAPQEDTPSEKPPEDTAPTDEPSDDISNELPSDNIDSGETSKETTQEVKAEPTSVEETTKQETETSQDIKPVEEKAQDAIPESIDQAVEKTETLDTPKEISPAETEVKAESGELSASETELAETKTDESNVSETKLEPEPVASVDSTAQTSEKKLDPRALFAKMKQAKEEGKELPKTETVEKKQSPKDILSMSMNELYDVAGVDINDEHVATQKIEEEKERKRRQLVPTYVNGFDDLFHGGGVPKGSAILVSGGPGSGKTTFCMQQLGYAAENGEKCLFMSFEETEEKLVEHMKEYGLDPEKYIKEGNLVIRKLDPFKMSRSVEALLAQARGELLIDINIIKDVLPEGFTPDRVVFDSLSAVAAAFSEDSQNYRIYVEQIYSLFKQMGVTAFLISEVHGTEERGYGGVEEFLADGVVLFYNIRKRNVRYTSLEILKMRGVKHEKKVVPFSFVDQKGIEVYPTEQLFLGD